MATAAPKVSRITRDDLEAKFRELEVGARVQAEAAKVTVVQVAAGLAVILALILFLLGRRSGRKRSTIVEIRRI